MKAICDVHLSYKLVNFLCSRNIEAVHVNQLTKKWLTPDSEIAEFADNNEMVLISKDEDFMNSHFLQAKPARLIRITLGNISNQQLIEIFDQNLLMIVNSMKAEKCYIEIGKQIIVQI
jgi:predicted nuclease of predicted toxin-antitoxin system